MTTTKKILIGIGTVVGVLVVGHYIWNSNAEWCCIIQYEIVCLLCRLGL